MKVNLDHWSIDLLGGCSGIAIALGLVRFDFGLIGSLMADAQWIDVEDIGTLAAINMLGYLAGCIQQAFVKNRNVSIKYIRIAIITIIGSIILEGRLIHFTSQSLLRLLCGWGAAHVVSGIPILALERVPEHWRRQATGLIMCGGGVGSLVGAVCIGLLAPRSATMAWNILAVLTITLSLPILRLVTRKRVSQTADSKQASQPDQFREPEFGIQKTKQLISLIILGFALMQVGQVPAILYEPLIAVHKIGISPMISSNIDSLFGVGLIIGGLVPTVAPQQLTTRLFLPLIAAVGFSGVILFGLSNNIALLSTSIFLIGLWDMMTGTLTLDRLGQLCDEDAQRRAWSTATSAGALGFILFSSATAQLSKHNIDLILKLGVVAVAIQLVAEVVQHTLSGSQKPQSVTD